MRVFLPRMRLLEDWQATLTALHIEESDRGHSKTMD